MNLYNSSHLNLNLTQKKKKGEQHPYKQLNEPQ